MWRATSAAAGSSMRRGLCLLVVVVLSTDSSCVGFQHAWRAPPLGCRSGAAEPAVGRSRGAALCSVLGLRGSGIIISAGSDDLDKELSRLQGLGPGLRDGQALEAPRWRSDELHREWELPLHGERVMFTTPRTHAGFRLGLLAKRAGSTAAPARAPCVCSRPGRLADVDGDPLCRQVVVGARGSRCAACVDADSAVHAAARDWHRRIEQLRLLRCFAGCCTARARLL